MSLADKVGPSYRSYWRHHPPSPFHGRVARCRAPSTPCRCSLLSIRLQRWLELMKIFTLVWHLNKVDDSMILMLMKGQIGGSKETQYSQPPHTPPLLPNRPPGIRSIMASYKPATLCLPTAAPMPTETSIKVRQIPRPSAGRGGAFPCNEAQPLKSGYIWKLLPAVIKTSAEALMEAHGQDRWRRNRGHFLAERSFSWEFRHSQFSFQFPPPQKHLTFTFLAKRHPSICWGAGGGVE